MHKEKQARQAAFQPQEQLDRFASQVTGIMGGYPGQVATTNVPNPTPLQTALGIGTTLAGLYLGKTIMMNRILKRPMFRRGGSAGTGITSGLDKPRQEY